MARISKRLNPPAAPSEPPPQANPEVSAASLQETPQAEQPSPFEDMLNTEYNHVLDEQISKALAKTRERFGRMIVQEHGRHDRPKDAVGKTSDDYEDLMNAIENKESRLGSNEEIYQMLYDLKFTEMRPLDVIKQEFERK